MARAMDSIAVLSSPSSSRLGISVARPAMSISLPAVSLPSCRNFAEFNGLKIQSCSKLSFASSNWRYPRVSKHKAGVVCKAQETAIDIPAVTDKTWASNVLEADGPVLVEFWAPWCGPCRMIHPVICWKTQMLQIEH